MQSLPEYLEVTLATVPPDKGDPIVETMTVTFPRLSRSAATALQGGAPGDQQSQPGSGTSATTGLDVRIVRIARNARWVGKRRPAVRTWRTKCGMCG